jgi:hypothetical protein
MAAYPDQLRFVYRDYPITSAESLIAAQAANCAGKQGAYWAYHDSLFNGEPASAPRPMGGLRATPQPGRRCASSVLPPARTPVMIDCARLA